jgi:Kef-type K+ transport system membrane component KefB
MEEHINFVPLLLIVVLAFLVPLIMGKVRWLPIVVGEILAGILIGRSGFNLVGENEILIIFSNIGLSFLMFLAGMEIDFDRLFPSKANPQKPDSIPENSQKGPSVLTLAGIVYMLTLALAVPAGFLLNRVGMPGDPWLLSFVLSATSLGVLLPIIKQRQMTYTLNGQAIFLSALLADFITVILLTIFLIVHQRGMDLQVFSIVLLFLAFFFAYRILSQFFAVRAIRLLVEELSQVTVQIKVRGAIAILMSFVVMASLLGLELILGAFLAGMMISLIRPPEDQELVHKLEAFGFGFFIPVFFIMVGVDMDLRSLLENPSSLIAIPVLLLVSVLVKLLPMFVFLKKLSLREVIADGFLLNTHLSIEIAIAVIGLRLGLLDNVSSTLLILFALLTVLIMPILFNVILPQDETKEKRKIIIFSGNKLGVQVANILRNYGEEIQILEPDEKHLETYQHDGFPVIHTPHIEKNIDELSQDTIQAFLALDNDDNLNLLACRTARRQGIPHIVSLVNQASKLEEFQNMDVNVFAPALYRPGLLALLTRSPDTFKLLTSTTDDRDVQEITISNPSIHYRRLYNLGLPGNLLVLAVHRDEETIIPHGKTSLHVGDRLTIMGNLEDLRDVSLLLES